MTGNRGTDNWGTGNGSTGKRSNRQTVNGQPVHANGAFLENFPCSISLEGSDLSECLIGLTKLYYVPLYAIREGGIRPSL